ncbi:MAG: hypothetical protein D6785_06560, partial [Planctomycetota bacterium]
LSLNPGKFPVPNPLQNPPLPPYKFLWDGQIYRALAIKSSENLKKEYLAFYQKYRAFGEPYHDPTHLVKTTLGKKPPFQAIRLLCRNYWRAIRMKRKEEAIALYNHISGDQNGKEVVEAWLKRAQKLEEYQQKAQKEEEKPIDYLFKVNDIQYIKEYHPSVDWNKSKAFQSSPYDGKITSKDLEVQDVIPASLRGLSESEKAVNRLLEEQKELHQNQLNELKAFLNKDLGPQNNGGDLVNVWCSKRNTTMTLSGLDGEVPVSVSIKLNGKYVYIDGTNKTTEKILLSTKPIKISFPLQIGYNTVEILALKVGKDGFASGTFTLTDIIRGKKKQTFYLDYLALGTFTIYLPPEELQKEFPKRKKKKQK